MAETMLLFEGMSPMTIPLQEPPVTWAPLVNCLPEQKLMKLAGSLIVCQPKQDASTCE